MTGTLTGTTINATTLQQGGTAIASTFAPIATSNVAYAALPKTGGTLTGALTGTTMTAVLVTDTSNDGTMPVLYIDRLTTSNITASNGMGGELTFRNARYGSNGLSISAKIGGYVQSGMNTAWDYHAMKFTVFADNGTSQIPMIMATGDRTLSNLEGGMVGIGTLAPLARIHVCSSNVSDGNWERAGILIENTDYGEAGLGITTAATSSNRWTIGMNMSNTALDIGYGTTASQISDGNSKLRVTTGGLVGIGTSNPGYLLDVAGDINFTGALRQNGSNYMGGQVSQWSNSNNGVYLLSSNVGVGLSNPAYAVDVVGDIRATNNLRTCNLVISGDVMPTGAHTQHIGTSNNPFNDAWIDTIHIAQNTLYLGNTPVLGTDANVIQITADVDQSINVKTTGNGITSLTSVSGVNVSASGMNAQVLVQSTGAGGKVSFGATT